MFVGTNYFINSSLSRGSDCISQPHTITPVCSQTLSVVEGVTYYQKITQPLSLLSAQNYAYLWITHSFNISQELPFIDKTRSLCKYKILNHTQALTICILYMFFSVFRHHCRLPFPIPFWVYIVFRVPSIFGFYNFIKGIRLF